jgi:hypothetical protein
MRRIPGFLSLLLIPFLWVSCETDFNVTANYKEVAIVYGLLNQTDSVHYLRINKAYLGEGNAITYAQIADSSSFGANIDVVLTETTPSGVKKEIVFDTVTLYTKEPGTFYSPSQLFYATAAKLNEKNTYELTITNRKTGNTVSSSTPLIYNFAITKPSSGSKSLNFKRTLTTQNRFTWENAKNGRRYQFKLFFNYKELNSGGDTTYRKIEWIFPEQISESANGIGETDVVYLNEDFYKLCENKIPYSDANAEAAVMKRFASVCNLEVYAVGDEFNTYLEANGPTTGVLMEKPTYSNITGGLGLFSCQYQVKRAPISLSSETIMDLSTTTSLKFAKPTN